MTDQRLEVRNLHKFYKANNVSDFTYRDLLETIESIAAKTKIAPANFILNKLEIGLNLRLPRPVAEVLPLFLDYKGKEFDKNRVGSKLWGVKCCLYEYLIKFYDKVIQVKETEKINIGGNILRYEIVYTKRRKVPIDTLEDLKDKNKVHMLMQKCAEIFETIRLLDQINFLNVNSRERELYFSGTQIEFWDIEKRLSKDTAKSKRARFKQIVEQNKNGDNKGLLLHLINEKIEVIMNG